MAQRQKNIKTTRPDMNFVKPNKSIVHLGVQVKKCGRARPNASFYDLHMNIREPCPIVLEGIGVTRG